MQSFVRFAFAAVCVACGLLPGPRLAEGQVIPIAGQNRATPVDFGREILPIFRKSCLACHNAKQADGGLVLETAAAILKGADSGVVVVPGKGDESALLKVASHRGEPRMPPPKNDVAAPNLTPQQLGLVKLWIDQGANGSNADSLSPENWRPLPKKLLPIYAVAVTPDGQFAACGRANQIFVYHVASGQLVTRLTDSALQANAGGLPGVAHRDIVQSLAFNPEGDLLASGGFREVKLWRRPRDVRRLELAAGQPVTAVAVSPDGSLAATAMADNTIRLWTLPDGAAGALLSGHTEGVTSLCFTADGSQLLSSSLDKSVRVWNVAAAALQGRIDAASPIRAISLVNEEAPLPVAEGEAAKTAAVERLVTAGDDTFLRLWKLPAGLSEQLAEVPAKSDVLAVSPDRKLLAIANAAGFVKVVNLETRETIHAWQAHEGAIHDLAFRAIPLPPAGNTAVETTLPAPVVTQLATAGADRTVRVWNYATGEPLAVFRGSLAPLRSVAWQKDGKRLVAGAEHGGLTIWNTEVPPSRTLAGNYGPANVSLLSPDGKLLAQSGSDNGRPAILVRQLETGAVTRTLIGHAEAVTSLAFSADNTKIVSGSADKTAIVWDLADAKFPEIARLQGHTGAVQGVAFNTDATQVLTGSADMTARLWRVADGGEVMNFAGHTGPVVAVAMPANQPTTASEDKTVRVWNIQNGQQLRAVTAPAAITAMAVSRDNAQLATAGADNSISLYPHNNLQLRLTLAGHAKPATSLAFSADNTRLVSGGTDGSAILWNIADGRLLELFPVAAGLSSAICGPDLGTLLLADAAGTTTQQPVQFGVALNGLQQAVTAVLFHSSNQTVYASSEDGTLRGFNAANGQQTFSANHGAPVHDLALSPNEQMLASAGENQLIRTWNSGGNPIPPQQLTGFTGAVTSVEFSADNTRVIGAGAGETGQLLVFNLLNAGELEQSLVGHVGGIPAIALASGERGERVISAGADETVRLWELNAIRRIAGHSQPVTSLAAIPNAPLQVLSGSRDATVRRWNLVNGQATLQMNHGGPVLAVAVRPDGQRFASVSENNYGRLWNAANGQQLGEMRGDIRARNIVAELTQQQNNANAKIAATKAELTAAEALVPTRTTAAKTAADALAKTDADLAAKLADLKKATDVKAAAEKVAIEAAAAAQKAALLKSDADQAVVAAQAAMQTAQVKLARAMAVAAAAPAETSRAQAVAEAQQALDAAAKQLEAANAAKAAPTLAAAAAAEAAGKAAADVLATNKPFVDAGTAQVAAQRAQAAAAQASEFASRDLKLATDAVPVIKDELASAEKRLENIKVDLEAAQKAATAAEMPLRTVAFSPDNLQVATGGDFGAIHTWNADTGVAVASHVGHQGPIPSLAFTPGEGLFAGSLDKSAVVWDLNPGWILERTIGKIDEPETLVHRVAALDFSDDGKVLATGGGIPSRSGELKLWNVADGTLLRDIPEPHTDLVYGVSISADGRFVATAGGDKYVRSFAVATGDLAQQFEGHTDHVFDVSWRADGKMLASCGADRTIMLWNPSNGDRFRTIEGFSRQVSSVRFVGATNITVSCSGDRQMRLHNSDNGGIVSNFAGAGGDFLYDVAATPNLQFIVAGGFDGVLRIWNGNAGNSQPLKSLAPTEEP